MSVNNLDFLNELKERFNRFREGDGSEGEMVATMIDDWIDELERSPTQLWGVSVPLKDGGGTDFYAVAADHPVDAITRTITRCLEDMEPEGDVEVTTLADLLHEQYGGFAKLSTDW